MSEIRADEVIEKFTDNHFLDSFWKYGKEPNLAAKTYGLPAIALPNPTRD